MLRARASLVAFVVLVIVAIAGAITAALPKKYAATARVLLAPAAALDVSELAPLAAARNISVSANGGSRMMVVEHVSYDPRVAATVVNDFVAANARKDMIVVDPASAAYQPVGPNLTLNLALGALAGLILGVGLIAFRERQPLRPPRADPPRADPRRAEPARRPDEALAGGVPDYEALCRELLGTWFASHRMLAIVEPAERPPRADVAARLACALTEAGRRFRVVLVDVPAEQDPRHPYAALAGGALIVAPQDSAHPAALQALHAELARVPARIVGTIVNPR